MGTITEYHVAAPSHPPRYSASSIRSCRLQLAVCAICTQNRPPYSPTIRPAKSCIAITPIETDGADPECVRYAQARASRSIFLFPWSAITGHFRNHAALGLVDPEARSRTWLTGVLGRETANIQRAPGAGQKENRKQKQNGPSRLRGEVHPTRGRSWAAIVWHAAQNRRCSPPLLCCLIALARRYVFMRDLARRIYPSARTLHPARRWWQPRVGRDLGWLGCLATWPLPGGFPLRRSGHPHRSSNLNMAARGRGRSPAGRLRRRSTVVSSLSPRSDKCVSQPMIGRRGRPSRANCTDPGCWWRLGWEGGADLAATPRAFAPTSISQARHLSRDSQPADSQPVCPPSSTQRSRKKKSALQPRWVWLLADAGGLAGPWLHQKDARFAMTPLTTSRLWSSAPDCRSIFGCRRHIRPRCRWGLELGMSLPVQRGSRGVSRGHPGSWGPAASPAWRSFPLWTLHIAASPSGHARPGLCSPTR